MHNPVRGRNRRKEDPEELAERHADGRDGPGLNHQEQSPAVEKSPQRAQRLAEVNVLPTGSRHHGRQFAVAQRANDGHEASDQPGANQQGRRIHFPSDFCRDNEDAGTDHRAHHQHGGAGQAQAFDQFFVLMSVEIPVADDTGRPPEFWFRCPWLVRCSVGGATAVGELLGLRRLLYPKMRKNASADLPGSGNKSDITATESAPASITERQLSRVIPPIATRGFAGQLPRSAHAFQPNDRIGIRFAGRGKHRPHGDVVGGSLVSSLTCSGLCVETPNQSWSPMTFRAPSGTNHPALRVPRQNQPPKPGLRDRS